MSDGEITISSDASSVIKDLQEIKKHVDEVQKMTASVAAARVPSGSQREYLKEHRELKDQQKKEYLSELDRINQLSVARKKELIDQKNAARDAIRISKDREKELIASARREAAAKRQADQETRNAQLMEQKRIAQRGQGILQIGYAVQDLQASGMRGIMNNIPGMLMSTGMSTAAIGAASIGAVAFQVIIENALKMWDEAMDKQLSKLDTPTLKMQSFKQSIAQAGTEAKKLAEEYKKIYDISSLVEKTSADIERSGKNRATIVEAKNERLGKADELALLNKELQLQKAKDQSGTYQIFIGGLQNQQAVLDTKANQLVDQMSLLNKVDQFKQDSLASADQGIAVFKQEEERIKKELEKEYARMSVANKRSTEEIAKSTQTKKASLQENSSKGNPISPANLVDPQLATEESYNKKLASRLKTQDQFASYIKTLQSKLQETQAKRIVAEEDAAKLRQIASLSDEERKTQLEITKEKLKALGIDEEMLQVKKEMANINEADRLRSFYDKAKTRLSEPLSISSLVTSLSSLGLAGSISGRVNQVLTTYETKSLQLLEQISKGVNKQISALG